MSDEFEDQQTMGELPLPIAVERSEDWKNKDVSSYTGVPPDIAASNNVMQVTRGPTSNISPAIPALVESTFDTRPVNARDFYTTGQGFFQFGTGAVSSFSEISLTHNVPQGYAGIIRGFKFRAVNPFLWPSNESRFDEFNNLIAVTLLRDDIIIPGYAELTLGQVQNDLIPIHYVVRENKSFTMRLKASNYYMTAINSLIGPFRPFYFSMELYGNELLSRGLPTEFENMSQTLTG